MLPLLQHRGEFPEAADPSSWPACSRLWGRLHWKAHANACGGTSASPYCALTVVLVTAVVKKAFASPVGERGDGRLHLADLGCLGSGTRMGIFLVWASSLNCHDTSPYIGVLIPMCKGSRYHHGTCIGPQVKVWYPQSIC